MTIERRQFLAGACGGLLGSLAFAGVPKWQSIAKKRDTPVQGTARNVIFIFLDGGPSHVDTFDLKTGSYTPNVLGVETLPGGMIWPSGIMPNLAQMTDKFSLVRSIAAVEQVHERAAYHLLTAHRPNAALTKEIPSFEAVVSFKLAEQRTAADTLPTVISVGRNVNTGFFPVDHKGISLGFEGRIENNQHYYEDANARFNLLDGLLQDVRNADDPRTDHMRIHDQARKLMEDPTLSQLFGEGDEDIDFDNPSVFFKQQCDTAIKAISAQKGCRVFRLELGGWDHHDQIYNEEGLPTLARALDTGLSHLITELEKLPGEQAGKTLLDETLIVSMGEFGRTVGNLNTSAGRDHYPYVNPAFMAGGGIAGGRIIGASDPLGAFITDPGWNRGRYMGVGDLMATMYSALGIDYLEQFRDTPSGRIFEIVESGLTGDIHAIDSLFS